MIYHCCPWLAMMYHAPIQLGRHGPGVVVTMSFNAKTGWPILECNLKTRDSQKWPLKRWPVLYGNIEWADLKQNNQSTTILTRRQELGGCGWLSSNVMEHIHDTPDLWESERLVRWQLGVIPLCDYSLCVILVDFVPRDYKPWCTIPISLCL